MPIKSFKQIPRDLVEWARFFRSTEVTPSDDSIGEDQIQDGEVTYPKLQDVTPDRILGRDTSPAGVVEELTVSGGLEFTGTGIRRSALTGDVTAGAGSTTTAFRNGAATSVVGRSVNSVGVLADIAAASDGQYFRRKAGILGFDALEDADIPATISRDAEVTAAIAAAIAALPVTASSTYTPTLTNVANLDSSTAYLCHYLRVGSEVTVAGLVDVNPTAAADTRLGISLPIASNFANLQDCAGTASNFTIQQQAGIGADVANDRAELRFLANDTNDRSMTFHFTYRII